MSKALINALLSICQNDADEYPLNKGFEAFAEEYNIGHTKGKKRVLAAHDRERIKTILLNEMGVDSNTLSSAWNKVSRSKALGLGFDEKLTREKVRDRRVAIKALPGRPLLLGDASLVLPHGANLDIDCEDVARLSGHEAVLVIENWSNFENTHLTPLLAQVDGNPLVVYRGDPIYPNDHCLSLLTAMRRPVYAFVDFDPAGLVIANGLPHFKEMVAPSKDELDALMTNKRNRERYALQKGKTPRALDEITHPQLIEMRQLIDHHGVALPQEILVND